MKVYISRTAQKVLDNAPEELKSRLNSKFSELIDIPYPQGGKKLRGATNSYRLRAGNHRVLSLIAEDTILVFKLLPEGQPTTDLELEFLKRTDFWTGVKASNPGRVVPLSRGQGSGPEKSTNEVVGFLPAHSHNTSE